MTDSSHRGALASAHSWLFVPGDRPDRFAKAGATAADVVVLDLEDAVDANTKDSAREHVSQFLTAGGRAVVRINAADTPWYEQDVERLVGAHGLLGLMVPKAEDPDGIDALGAELRGVDVIPLVETAAGLDAATELVGRRSVVRLAFGSLDYALDIDASHTRDALAAARSALVFASRRAGTARPVDGVTTDFSRVETTVDDATYARNLGFGGKLCIHPSQVDAVNEVFTPSAEEIRWAELILASMQTGGVSAVAGAMVDKPVVERAERLLRAVRRPTDERP